MRTPDRGDTLIEVLVAVTILAIGVTAIVGALGAMASTTIANRGQARAETALLAASEYVKTMPLTAADFTSCGPAPATLIASQVAVPAGFVPSFAQGSAAPGTTCDQLIQIPVQVTGEGFTLSVAVVRRP